MTRTFMFTALVGSSVACLLSNSWLVIWLTLEINTLAFCCLLKPLAQAKNKSTNELGMKYFIFQAIPSAILLMAMLMEKDWQNSWFTMATLAVIAIMVKLASAPFHEWYLYVLKDSQTKEASLLMTWQKMQPLYLILYQMKKFIFPFVILSLFMGALLQINQNHIMKIMGMSSVFNLSWMLLAIAVNSKICIIFCAIYWVSVIFMMEILKKSKLKDVTSSPTSISEKWLIMAVLSNLAGLPPFSGFLAKWMVFTEYLKLNFQTLIIILLTVSAINFFIYLRMFTKIFACLNSLSQAKNFSNHKNFLALFLMFNFLALPLIFL